MNVPEASAAHERCVELAGSIFRYDRSDALFVTLALAHGVVLLVLPFPWVIAAGLWWNSNTIGHHFIHRPFFRARWMNQVFSAYLSGLLGIPQSLWRQRHLAHHGDRKWRLRITSPLCVESLIIGIVWSAFCFTAPRFFLSAYLPGYLLGLGLCWLQGHYEHARGTTSHYGSIYNWLFFNDGYHVEHHLHPAADWRTLPFRRHSSRGSPWPPVLRWMETFTLDSLERFVLRSPRLQRFVLQKHERAFRKILPALPAAARVGIVGGGLFPRTALILRRLLPDARLTIIDASQEHIGRARRFIGREVQFENALFDAHRGSNFDLLVIPLSFIGDRQALYRHPPARTILIHDWLWRREKESAWISVALMKRLNLIRREECAVHENESG